MDTNLMHPEQWINECEHSFSEELKRVARAIHNQGRIKFICLTGPTCSGKTTAANLLVRHLAEFGRCVHTISLDDFYFDKEILHRLSRENGRSTPDYDSVRTIDLSALRTFISECVEEKECHCPIFDFQKGMRTGYRTISCQGDDLFIMEGIQVLYPEILSMIEVYPSISVYIAPQSAISVGDAAFLPNELRLLRRLVRDHRFRGTPPEQTFALWESVRDNEEKNIFPHVLRCELSIDSTMPYEIGILKPWLVQILSEIPTDSAYKEKADEILERIRKVTPISDRYIKSDFLYKEFL